MHRTQIPNTNAAIRGFSTSFSSHTYTNNSSTSPMVNDDMNVFNVNIILPFLNTIKVFLTNFIKSKYSVACDNQYKSIEYNNSYIGAAGQPTMPHKTTDHLVLHPCNKFDTDECSYNRFDCSTNTFSCLNYMGTENKIFPDNSPMTMSAAAQNVYAFHCKSKPTDLNNRTKDIEYLMADLHIWPLPSTSQPSPQLPAAKHIESTVLPPKTLPSTKTMDNGLANGRNDAAAAGKSQHSRKKNRGKNRKTSNEVNNNNSQRIQANCGEKKSNRKNRNRKRSNCVKAKTMVPVADSHLDDIMCITTETVVTDVNFNQTPSFGNDGKILHQTTSRDENCFFTTTTMTMFINPFESDRPLARREQHPTNIGGGGNCRQRRISDSSDDFICFELSDNEIEPQMIYTSGCGNIWDSNRVNVNKCDYGSGHGKRWTNDYETDDDDDSIGNSKNKKVCSMSIYSIHFYFYCIECQIVV